MIQVSGVSASSISASSSPTVPFQVQRLNGVDRYETAAKIAQDGWTSTADSAILAAGMDDNLVDALAYFIDGGRLKTIE